MQLTACVTQVHERDDAQNCGENRFARLLLVRGMPALVTDASNLCIQIQRHALCSSDSDGKAALNSYDNEARVWRPIANRIIKADTSSNTRQQSKERPFWKKLPSLPGLDYIRYTYYINRKVCQKMPQRTSNLSVWRDTVLAQPSDQLQHVRNDKLHSYHIVTWVILRPTQPFTKQSDLT